MEQQRDQIPSKETLNDSEAVATSFHFIKKKLMGVDLYLDSLHVTPEWKMLLFLLAISHIVTLLTIFSILFFNYFVLGNSVGDAGGVALIGLFVLFSIVLITFLLAAFIAIFITSLGTIPLLLLFIRRYKPQGRFLHILYGAMIFSAGLLAYLLKVLLDTWL